MKWHLLLFFCCFLIACNNGNKDITPADEILSRQPYAPITDSLAKDAKNAELYFRRAVLLNKNELAELAVADFRQGWQLTKDERFAVAIGTILVDKQPDSAIVFLEPAVKELPQSIFLQLSLARAYAATGRTDEALSTCDKLLLVQPDQVNTLLLKAELLEKKDDGKGMIAVLERAHALLPDNLDVGEKLAYQYAENKNVKAILLADSLISRDTLQLHTEPYYIKGVYYSNIKEGENAIRLFDETIRHDHRYLNAYLEKGKILLDQKKTDAALKTFKLANTISPAFPDAWFWMGKCLEVLGQKAEAKLNYEKAYGLDKSFLEAKEAAEQL